MRFINKVKIGQTIFKMRDNALVEKTNYTVPIASWVLNPTSNWNENKMAVADILSTDKPLIEPVFNSPATAEAEKIAYNLLCGYTVEDGFVVLKTATKPTTNFTISIGF